MMKKKAKKPRPPDVHLTLDFEHQARRLPPADHPTLLTHLRRLRRHARTFYQLDPDTGHWRRV